jgi:mRNA interferase RelE/StbE
LKYRLLITRRAQKELESLPPEAYERTRDAIRDLGSEPRPANSRKLTGRSGWRIRVGSYRVIYEIDDRTAVLTVLHIGHRRDVYR